MLRKESVFTFNFEDGLEVQNVWVGLVSIIINFTFYFLIYLKTILENLKKCPTGIPKNVPLCPSLLTSLFLLSHISKPSSET